MIELLWGRAKVRLGYFRIGHMSGRANVYRASVRGLLSSQVTFRSDYCPVGLCVFRVTFHRATVCQRCVHGEVSVGIVSGRATVLIPLDVGFIEQLLLHIVFKISLVPVVTVLSTVRSSHCNLFLNIAVLK